jgi:hypothetical protein
LCLNGGVYEDDDDAGDDDEDGLLCYMKTPYMPNLMLQICAKQFLHIKYSTLCMIIIC